MKWIPLTKDRLAMVDDEDYERISARKWFVIDSHPRHHYACRWNNLVVPRKAIRMHHEVLDIDVSYLHDFNLVVDHINRDSLDNRKENLHIVSRRDNAVNSTRSDKALGIYYEASRQTYKVFELLPERKYIGTFKTFGEAAKARGLLCE